ncbi:MAG: AmmeMemoRadiSam system protein B [Clostridiales bacterium]|nr:AmmeMemoRadiSam system protein B [Clostridiales bacterium]
MKKLRIFYVAALCLLLTLPACRAQTPNQAMPEDMPYISQAVLKDYLDCIHYDERGFYKALENAAPYQIEGEMLAATSPHFLPAMSFTANILSTLAREEQPRHTIFVLAPNHSGEGLPLIVADRGWSTPFGYLELDEEATAAILKSPQLADKIDIDLLHLQSDHSAATLMPFIKYFLPQTQVVTIILGRDCPLEQLKALAGIIHATAQIKSVFVLASVDFSHYLHIEETAQRDEVTKALIQAGDIQAIKRLDGGNMDSPESMITLINYTKCFGDVQVERREHIILAESEIKKDIGYSYSAYVFSHSEQAARQTAADIQKEVILDGSTANIPLAQLLLQRYYGLTEEEAAARVNFHRTSASYRYLVEKQADLLLVNIADQETQYYLDNCGVELEYYPLRRDALCFIVNESNPLNNISHSGILDIYQGRINNWRRLGGNDNDIVAYQRNEDSGSQALMRELVMTGREMVDAPPALLPAEMGLLLDVLARHNADGKAIGYCTYYYASTMYAKTGLKFLAVDGVAPNNETIGGGKYPYINEYSIVIRAEEPAGSPVRQMLAWLLSPAGSQLVQDLGYVPVKY